MTVGVMSVMVVGPVVLATAALIGYRLLGKKGTLVPVRTKGTLVPGGGVPDDLAAGPPQR